MRTSVPQRQFGKERGLAGPEKRDAQEPVTSVILKKRSRRFSLKYGPANTPG